jgi:hypothetical protein
MRVEARARLPAAPEQAWKFLLMWERQPEWMVDAASVRIIGHWREGVGTRVAVKTRILGIPAFTETLEVTVWEPPTRLVMAHGGMLRGMGEWRLEGTESDDTLFRWIENVRLSVPILGEAALRVYRPIMRRLMRRSLENLSRSLR